METSPIPSYIILLRTRIIHYYTNVKDTLSCFFYLKLLHNKTFTFIFSTKVMIFSRIWKKQTGDFHL